MPAAPAEVRYELLKTELLLCQAQMDKYDGISSTTKTWTLTLWVASLGWTIQSQNETLALLGAAAVVLFWFFDGYNKKFRQDYKARRDEVEDALRQYYKSGDLPETASAPNLPSHEKNDFLSNMLRPHVGVPYLALLLVSVFLYITL